MRTWNRMWFAVAVSVCCILAWSVITHAEDSVASKPPVAEQPANNAPSEQSAEEVTPPVQSEEVQTPPLTDLEVNALREFMRIMASGTKEQQSSTAVSAAEPITASVQKSAGDDSSSAQSALVREVPYDRFTMKLNCALAEERRCRDIFYRNHLRSSADEIIQRALRDLDGMIVGIQGVEESALAVLRFYEKERHTNQFSASSLQDWAERSLIEARLFREGLEVERSAIIGIREHPEAEYALYSPSFDRPDDPNGQWRSPLDEMLLKRILSLDYELSQWSQEVERLNYDLFMALLADRSRVKLAQEQEQKDSEAPK